MELHRSIVEQLATARMELPFDDQQDFIDAQRGFIGPLTQPLVKATDGRVVWDANAWFATLLASRCSRTDCVGT